MDLTSAIAKKIIFNAKLLGAKAIFLRLLFTHERNRLLRRSLTKIGYFSDKIEETVRVIAEWPLKTKFVE